MATKPNFVSIPLSFYYNGIWQSANWSVGVVNDDTGEIVLSAELPSGDDNGPFAALRLTMADVATLRTLAGFTQSIPVQQSDPSHSSNPSELGDVGRRLAALEAAVSPAIANPAWMDEVEKRIDALVIEAAKKFSKTEQRLDELEIKAAAAAVHLAQLPGAVHSIDQFRQRLSTLERLNLASRVLYLENRAQGITGPDAGL